MPERRYVGGDPEYVPGRGHHFELGVYAELPMQVRPTLDWTLEGWFIWSSGKGPLIAAEEEDWSWGWLYEDDGTCVYRIGGVMRQAGVDLASVRGPRLYIAVAKAGNEAVLWINDDAVDRWTDAPPTTLSDAVVMKFADGFAENFGYYDRRLADDELASHWDAGNPRLR